MDLEAQEPTDQVVVNTGKKTENSGFEEKPRSLSELDPSELREVIRHFRFVRSDLLRNAAWNTRNISDDEFRKTPDERAFGYFKQDLLETRLVDRARRLNVVEVWRWFDDIATGHMPVQINGQTVFLRIEDKDIDKVRKRMTDLRGFLPILENDDYSTFKRIRFKLRRTVLRMTYDLHNLMKRMEKYRKRQFEARSSGEAEL